MVIMKFCKQDISKSITAMSFHYGQLIEDNERINLVKIIFFYIFLAIALCKSGHRKLDISKIITARSFKLGRLIEDNE